MTELKAIIDRGNMDVVGAGKADQQWAYASAVPGLPQPNAHCVFSQKLGRQKSGAGVRRVRSAGE